MFISDFRIGNYKSFVDSGILNLGQGFNVVCGQNNSGKTALLEALDFGTQGTPHRSLVTVPTERSNPAPQSWLEISFAFSRAEFLEFLREVGPTPHSLYWPEGVSWDDRQSRSIVDRFLNQDQFTFRLRRDYAAGAGGWKPQTVPTYGLYRAVQNAFVDFRYNLDGSISDLSRHSGNQADLGVPLIGEFRKRIYRFTAERVGLGVCAASTDPRLSANASNLPAVLQLLQGNTPKLAYFNSLVHEILPQIYQISTVPPAAGQVEIRVWTIDPVHRRLDLTMPLAQCGTGVGQVLAILYVALFSTAREVIIIDEPQSFLHPGAIRKLVQVLKSESKHQYIIATHSPTVIAVTEPDTINVCRISEGVSTLTPIEPSDAKDIQSYLVEVGARLSDVFGADNILWVEGRTEEICFPMILEEVGRRRLRGTALLAVSNTGDLQTRDAERIFDIYNRLSRRNSLLPPALAFIFDSECRTQAEKIDLHRRSGGLLKFLPRRMYENYLLNENAIAAVANEIAGFRENAVTGSEVVDLLSAMEADGRFVCPAGADLAGQPWRVCTNGAKVLEDVFARLSETRVAFDKTTHAVLLTKWLLSNAPDDVREVCDLIGESLPVAEV